MSEQTLNILVTGAKGQLGTELRRCLDTMEAEIGKVPEEYAGASAAFIDYDELDISDEDAVIRYIDDLRPDIVINCAAFTNVDACESDEDSAYAVNALGAGNLAKACEKAGAKLVHISTDYVFPGNIPGERVESDETGPISAYGRTKLAGENAVKKETDRYFIVRTAWLYGYEGRNFVKTMKRLGENKAAITVVDDQLGNPTSANDLAYELLKLALTDEYGIYHCTNNGTVSWADFAKAIMDGYELDCEVIPVTSEEYKRANPDSADRPKYSSLRNSHLESTIGDEMRDWEDALREFIENSKSVKG